MSQIASVICEVNPQSAIGTPQSKGSQSAILRNLQSLPIDLEAIQVSQGPQGERVVGEKLARYSLHVFNVNLIDMLDNLFG